MSESENTYDQGVRVNDRRRFNPDGTPREDGAEPAAQENVEQTNAQAPQQARADAPETARLEEELEAARRRIDELARAIQAGEREREDFKKRVQRERERMIEVEKGNVAQILLETVDELELSLGAADASPLAQGVRMIRDGIVARLANLGVERVELVGRPYDPNLAEAVDMEITADQAQDQTVTLELRPAYRMGGRVIREGKVKVARYVKPADA